MPHVAPIGRIVVGGIIVTTVAVLAFAGTAASEPTSEDGAPPKTVAFFATSVCPPGWAPAAAGRVIVGTTDGSAVGTTHGTPLSPKEDRTHTHDAVASVTLPTKSITAFNGGNDQGACAGTVTAMTVTGASSTGLPFLQLLACEKP